MGFRSFTPALKARVELREGMPKRLDAERGIYGNVLQAAGPWRTSGDWWSDRPRGSGGAGRPGGSAWNRDEWDVSLSDGAVYRVFRDRDTDAWFVDAIVD